MKLRNKSGACNVKMMSAEGIESTTCDDSGLGLFVHAMVGLDHTAAKRAFDVLLYWKLIANQMSHRRIPVYAFNLRSKCNDS
jgi:hypothetical protein